MSGLPAFPSKDDWHDPEPLPASSVGTIHLKDGGLLPVYFCLKCEARSAVEGKPATPALLTQYGSEETLHICTECGYTRSVMLPADLKEKV